MIKRSLNQIKELHSIGSSGIRNNKTNPILTTPKWVGMRTLKTGLSIVAALYCSSLPFINSPFYVVMGTIFALQSTVKDSFTMGRNRISGTLLGGLVAFVFACLPWRHPILIGLAGILTILICNRLKNSSSILIALTICLSILISVEDQHPLLYSLFRTTDTIVGLSLGILINYFIARPNYFQSVLTQFEYYHHLVIEQLTELTNSQSLNLSLLSSELDQLDEVVKHYLSDTIEGCEKAIQVHLILEKCHDLRFYLKGLYFSYEEGYALPVSISDEVAPHDLTTTPSEAGSIPDYYLIKLRQTLYQTQEQLNFLKQQKK